MFRAERGKARQAFETLRGRLDDEGQARAVVVALLAVASWERTGAALWTPAATTLATALAPARTLGLTPLLAEVPEDQPLPLDALWKELRTVPDEALPVIHQDLLGLGSDRRKQGSYYTPRALADALAELVLAPLLAARADDELADLRVVDPAAGAGDLLLAALRRLEAEFVARGLPPDRRRIAGCVLSADTDPCAVVLARLAVQRWAHRDGWPPLPVPWIQWGDGLLEVVPDPLPEPLAEAGAFRAALGTPGERAAAEALERAMSARSAAPRSEAERLHGEPVRAIHWRSLLPTGVDGVIGNPPYHREQDGRSLFDAVRRSRLGRFARSKGDLWFFFTHLALDLLRPGGQHAFVVPGYWLKATGAGPRALRADLAERAAWRALVDLRELDVFEGVAGRHVVFAVERAPGAPPEVELYQAPRAASLDDVARALRQRTSVGAVRRTSVRPGSVYGDGGEVLIDLGLDDDERALLRRLTCGRLPTGWELSEGITANPERVTSRALSRLRAEGQAPPNLEVGAPVFLFPADQRDGLSARERDEHLLPWLRPCELRRISSSPALAEEWLIYTTPANAPDPASLPNLIRHLRPAKPLLDRRRETRKGSRRWFHLHWPRRPSLFEGERVFVPRMTRWPSAATVDGRCAVGESVFVIVPRERSWSRLVTTLLNSLPFAAGILLTTKRRGRGIDIPRAALARCPWPSEAQLEEAARDLGRPGGDGDLEQALAGAWEEVRRAPLAVAALACERLEARHAAQLEDAPWWRHPHTVSGLGQVVDEGVCRLLDLPYPALKELVDGHQKSALKN